MSVREGDRFCLNDESLRPGSSLRFGWIFFCCQRCISVRADNICGNVNFRRVSRKCYNNSHLNEIVIDVPHRQLYAAFHFIKYKLFCSHIHNNNNLSLLLVCFCCYLQWRRLWVDTAGSNVFIYKRTNTIHLWCCILAVVSVWSYKSNLWLRQLILNVIK